MCICRGLHLVVVVAVLVQGLLVEVSSKEDWRNWVLAGKGRDWEILNVLVLLNTLNYFIGAMFFLAVERCWTCELVSHAVNVSYLVYLFSLDFGFGDD